MLLMVLDMCAVFIMYVYACCFALFAVVVLIYALFCFGCRCSICVFINCLIFVAYFGGCFCGAF